MSTPMIRLPGSQTQAFMLYELLTVVEIATILRVTPATVQRWCRERSLPAVKVGKGYRISRVDLERWYAVRRRDMMGEG